MGVTRTSTWISRDCRRCGKMQAHTMERGESKKARWVQYECFTCGRVFNATSRKNQVSRALDENVPAGRVRSDYGRAA